MDLINDGFDVNIRAGWLDDSAMMSRKLGESARALVVGSDYAATRPAPAHPCDLEDWDWVRYRHRSDYTRLSGPGGEEAKVLGQARLEVDSVDALYHFACKNLGATVLPEHLAARGEAEGKLSRLFPRLAAETVGNFCRLARHLAAREPHASVRSVFGKRAPSIGRCLLGHLAPYEGGICHVALDSLMVRPNEPFAERSPGAGG